MNHAARPAVDRTGRRREQREDSVQTRCPERTVSDEALIDRARRGDMRAHDELVTCYRARAVRIARSFVRDREAAHDVAQEAFVRAFLSIRRLRNPAAFETYLTRTIVRLAIDRSRKASSGEIPVGIEPQPADPPTPPEEAIHVRLILGRLSRKLRAVMVLRDVAGMDYASIARALRIPIGTVRSRLSAARAAFKSLYLGDNPSEGGTRA
jgi:RNA polymerase sigma-70 factor (ECF subfamily)